MINALLIAAGLAPVLPMISRCLTRTLLLAHLKRDIRQREGLYSVRWNSRGGEAQTIVAVQKACYRQSYCKYFLLLSHSTLGCDTAVRSVCSVQRDDVDLG